MWNKVIYLKDYKEPSYKVEEIFLDFDIFDEYTIVVQKSIFYKNINSNKENNLELFWEDLELLWVFLDWKEYKNYIINNENNLILENIPDKFEIKIITKIYPEKNTTLMWLYMSGWKYSTQCESEGFRRMTYYLDRPDVMTEFTTKIRASKKYPFLLSNWNQIEKWDLENNRHYVVWHDPFKKPSYLFALVAWDFEYLEDNFVTKSGKNVKLQIFADSHNIDKCDFAMDSLKKAMKWDEDRFWLEYDLDLFMIVAIDDFNSWAMENKWLNIFNSQAILASKDTTTDNEYIYVERVIWHEYFHNWTWDRVTCRDWFQLSLKEGLTVFRDSEFTADMQSRAVKRIEDVRYLRTYQFKEDASPMAHPIRPSFFEEISNFYTVTVYEKWSEVVWMYQTILWKEWFRKWMDLYFKRHDWQAVTTEDFLSAMQDANSIDLSQFSTWYNQAWTPIVDVVDYYDENNNTYSLQFTQSCPDTPESSSKKPFIIPIKFGLLEKTWKEIEIDNDLIILTEYKQEFVFENINSKPIPSLLRNFSAPIIINYNYSHFDYSFLMQNDNDTFNRFEASQKYAKDLIIDIYYNWEKDIEVEYIDAIKSILNNTNLDDAFKAEVITLPSEVELSGLIWKNVNPILIHKSREFFILELSKALKIDFENIYNSLNNNIEYKFDPIEIWKRKLKNACLNYISILSWPDIAYEQYLKADNMTDKLFSLTCLSNINCIEMKKALDDFYIKWRDNNNVITKWFSIQAKSNLDFTLDAVKELTTHELFDFTNPNKVRSLFNSFANENPYLFNSKDGYRFVSDAVIKLDMLNPMIASRLAKSLIWWKKLEPKLWKLLKSELIRISKINNLSNDLSEIINKSLK